MIIKLFINFDNKKRNGEYKNSRREEIRKIELIIFIHVHKYLSKLYNYIIYIIHIKFNRIRDLLQSPDYRLSSYCNGTDNVPSEKFVL